MSCLYLGYDPGGGGAHGVAAIDGRDAVCDTMLTAQSAIDWFCERCREREPSGFGVDTLTMWSSGPSGWRPADRALRAAYVDVANSVTAPNSLYGAMSINGAVVVRALCHRFKSLRISETHPKVLYFALTGDVYDYDQHADQMVQNLIEWIALGDVNVDSEHAWDALVSAFAVRQWDIDEWSNDLHQLPHNDGETLIPVHGTGAHYAWPTALPLESYEQPPEGASHAPARTAGASAPRGRDRWKIAVERLQRAGHDDVAQQVAEYRNARNGRSGWDAWLKSNFPALWNVYEAGD